MKINLFSGLNLQKNDYRGKDKNKNVSFGAPPMSRMNLTDYIPIPTSVRIGQEAIKAEIRLKRALEEKYNQKYMEQVNRTADKAYRELQERENVNSTYDAGLADHHND